MCMWNLDETSYECCKRNNLIKGNNLEMFYENYLYSSQLLSEKLNYRKIDAAFVILDPRQEKDYDRGMCRKEVVYEI